MAASDTELVEVVPRGGRPRDESREQAILDAAIDLLAEVGYEGMSIEAVAVRAKSSKATIYRRWPGKAELVADAMRRRSEPILEDLPDTGSLRSDLLALALRMFDGMKGVDGGLMCGLAVAVRTAGGGVDALEPVCGASASAGSTSIPSVRNAPRIAIAATARSASWLKDPTMPAGQFGAPDAVLGNGQSA